MGRTFSLKNNKDKILKILQKDLVFLSSKQMIYYTLVVYTGNITLLNEDKVIKENRALISSTNDEWIIIGGFINVWKQYSKLHQVSTKFNVFSKEDNKFGIDPASYQSRFEA